MFSSHDRNGSTVVKNSTNKNSTSNRCLSMDFTSSSLNLSSCEQKYQFVCEVRVFLDPNVTNELNVSYFSRHVKERHLSNAWKHAQLM
jgi:hypothetical protein